MAKEIKFSKCMMCGKVVAVDAKYPCPTVCCGDEMVDLVPNTVDASKEKHVPVVTVTDKDIIVKIGEVEHPMEEDHYIQWIALKTKYEFNTRFLDPGKPAQSRFAPLCSKDCLLAVYIYCNKHGQIGRASCRERVWLRV